MFGTQPYDRQFLSEANAARAHELRFLEPRLDAGTAPLATGCGAICAFVNDTLDAATLEILASLGVRIVALRCAGYNNVDLKAAERLQYARGGDPFGRDHLATVAPLRKAAHRNSTGCDVEDEVRRFRPRYASSNRVGGYPAVGTTRRCNVMP